MLKSVLAPAIDLSTINILDNLLINQNMYYFALNLKEQCLVLRRFENKTSMVLLFSTLCLFTSGPIGLSAVLAQEETGSNPGSNLDTTRCEATMSNVTLPSAKEDVLPPNMYAIYGDRTYQGELSQSKYREGETFSNLDILPENISSDIPAEAVEIIKDTCAQFVVVGTPSTLPPDSLDISAYAMNGTSVAVLNATEEDTSTFRINLPTGLYILLTSTTWIPSSADEYVTGYVIYKFLANVTEN